MDYFQRILKQQQTEKNLYENTKPLEHFHNEWSLDLDRQTGVMRVQSTRLESKELKKGGTDVFRGDRAGVLNYIKNTYPGVVKKIVFV